MPQHPRELIRLAEEILERAGVVVISQETADAIKRIELQFKAGLSVSDEELAAVRYAVATTMSDAEAARWKVPA